MQMNPEITIKRGIVKNTTFEIKTTGSFNFLNIKNKTIIIIII